MRARITLLMVVVFASPLLSVPQPAQVQAADSCAEIIQAGIQDLKDFGALFSMIKTPTDSSESALRNVRKDISIVLLEVVRYRQKYEDWAQSSPACETIRAYLSSAFGNFEDSTALSLALVDNLDSPDLYQSALARQVARIREFSKKAGTLMQGNTSVGAPANGAPPTNTRAVKFVVITATFTPTHLAQVVPTSTPAITFVTQMPSPAPQDNIGQTGNICPGTHLSCSQLSSCAEARACLAAGNKSLDRDGDGIPCESLCK